MSKNIRNLKTCSKGHHFYKSSTCLTCPVCEEKRKPQNGWLAVLAAPARRAMENKGINSLKQLSAFSENELLQFHGLGKSTISILKTELAKKGLQLKNLEKPGKQTDKSLKKNETVMEKYIQTFPEPVQEILINLRTLVKKLAPEAEEGIAYGIPGYKTNSKPLIYFAAFKNHIGLYATPSGHKKFEKELAAYKQGKGSVQFPLDQAIPYPLIKRIVKFRVEENNNLKESKKK